MAGVDALVVILVANNVQTNLGKKLSLRISLSSIQQLLPYADDASSEFQVGENRRSRHWIRWRVSRSFNQCGHKPLDNEFRQIGTNFEQVGSAPTCSWNLADIERLIPKPRGLFRFT